MRNVLVREGESPELRHVRREPGKGFGATALNLICPITTSLNTGVFLPDGLLDVRLHFDHRVIDGMPATRLAELEEVLRTEMVAELMAIGEKLLAVTV
ncbi:MAG: hypothetical protein U0792_23440 [Gemmataceae bacterium]